eukprot:4600637-Prymnesium_polylepis.1
MDVDLMDLDLDLTWQPVRSRCAVGAWLVRGRCAVGARSVRSRCAVRGARCVVRGWCAVGA